MYETSNGLTVMLDVLNGFYTLEKQNEMGVVGIRVEVL